MAKEFSLSIYPWVYLSKFANHSWNQKYIEKPHLTPIEEEKLSFTERQVLFQERNKFPELPLVNYSTQYAMSVFEGLKAFPQPNGSLKLFRPNENAKRMQRSMEGLYMPSVPVEQFVSAVKGVVAKNQNLGFAPKYNSTWESDDFTSGHSVYIRPFSYTESGIGINLSKEPWFVIISTQVGSYFSTGTTSPITTTLRSRATSGGTGWIKCSANYVTSVLAKTEAESEGYMECIFLDAKSQTYIEEGSSCNLFFVLKNGNLVTPQLSDTILPGITRQTVIELAIEQGITVEERLITIEEIMTDGVEAFGTGTAAGITHFSSINHKGNQKKLGAGQIGPISKNLLNILKGIQYGAKEDYHNWMTPVND